MKRPIIFGVILTLLAAVHPVSAQFISPRQGGAVIGNNSSEVISVQAPLQSPLQKTIAAEPKKETKETSEYVIVTGQVSQPGVYEYRNGIASLAEMIDQAGGLTSFSGHEFFVYRSPKGFLKLDLPTHANFAFQSGDILIAETPIRYYQELGNPGAKFNLYDLHPKTQVILINLADRPVLLTVPPSAARLSALLELLNQGPEAMVGVEKIPPPHSLEIPKHAQLAPSLIPSCSIISFDPKRINRDALPTLPSPMIGVPSKKIRIVSQETPAPKPKSEAMKPSGLFEWKQISNDTPLAQYKPPQAVANGSLLANPETLPADSILSHDQPVRTEAPKVAEKAPEISLAAEKVPAPKMLFSPQQKAIVIGFCVVIGLFVIAYVVRRKQEQRELLPLAADTAKHTNSIISLYTKIMHRISGQTTENSDLEKLQAASETVASVAEAASSVAELASDERREAELVEAVDSDDHSKSINPEVENRLVQFVNRITASSSQSDRSLVEMLVELAASQENKEHESVESPIEQSAEPAPESPVPATIDTRSVTQPMFPMIWEQKIEQSGTPEKSKIEESEESVEANTTSEVPPENAPQGDHPIANGPHRIPLDRVFFAVQRERSHKESTDR